MTEGRSLILARYFSLKMSSCLAFTDEQDFHSNLINYASPMLRLRAIFLVSNLGKAFMTSAS